MRIVHFSSEDLSMGIASTTHIMEIAENLAKFGHKVTVIVPDLGRLDRATNVNIKYLPTINLRFIRTILFEVVSFAYLLYFYFKVQPHCIYQRGDHIVTALISQLTKIPLVTEINGLILDQKRLLNASWAELKLIRLVQQFSFKVSRALIFVSDGLKRVMFNEYNFDIRKAHVISNGANINLFKPMDRNSCCKEVGLYQDNLYIGFVGSFYAHHGLKYLVNAAPSVISEHPEVQFVLVGDGYIRAELIEYIQRRNLTNYFHLPGKIPYKKVPKYINSFDVCVFLYDSSYSCKECILSPLKLFEYLACAKPVLTCNEPGIKDIVVGNNIGLSVKSDDYIEISRAINFMLNNASLRYEMGERGRKLVVKNYSWSATAQKTLQVIKKSITPRYL